MLEKVNICTAKKFPEYRTMVVLPRKKLVNTYKLNIGEHTRTLSSHDIGDDISGALYCGNECFLGFNVKPSIVTNNYSYITKILGENFQQMIDVGEDIKGFLCGGLSNSLNTKMADASYGLYNKIAEILDSFEIPFGMICGKNKDNTVDNLKLYKNTIYMCGEYLRDCLSQKDPTQITPDNLNGIYENVFMPEDISLNFISEKDFPGANLH